MTWTTPFTAVVGDVITAAGWNTSARDNLLHLRGMLPDPGQAGLILTSTGAATAAWTSPSPVNISAWLDLDDDVQDELWFYLPSLPNNLYVALRGRLPRAGLLAIHSHPLSINANGVHSHGLDTSDGLDTVQTTSSPPDRSIRSNYIIQGGLHIHTGAVGSAGSGGYAAPQRPAGVTLSVDGVDRTSALGGPWGTTGGDWDVVDLNIRSFVTSTGQHRIGVKPTQGGGRLVVQVYGF